MTEIDSNVLCTFEWMGSKLTLTDTGKNGPMGHHFVLLRLEDEGRVIFDGQQMGVPSHQAIDGLDAVMSAFSWLTLKPGDTDDEFFAEYTESQLAWANSARADELACLAFDYDCMGSSDRNPDFKLLTCPDCEQKTPIYRDYLAPQRCCWCGVAVKQALKVEEVLTKKF